MLVLCADEVAAKLVARAPGEQRSCRAGVGHPGRSRAPRASRRGDASTGPSPRAPVYVAGGRDPAGAETARLVPQAAVERLVGVRHHGGAEALARAPERTRPGRSLRAAPRARRAPPCRPAARGSRSRPPRRSPGTRRGRTRAPACPRAWPRRRGRARKRLLPPQGADERARPAQEGDLPRVVRLPELVHARVGQARRDVRREIRLVLGVRPPGELQRQARPSGDLDGEVRPLLGRVPPEVEEVAVVSCARRASLSGRSTVVDDVCRAEGPPRGRAGAG